VKPCIPVDVSEERAAYWLHLQSIKVNQTSHQEAGGKQAAPAMWSHLTVEFLGEVQILIPVF
jgi:hypothetical protein